MVWWFHLQNQAITKTERQTKPQEYMSELTIVNYNEQGTPKEKLQADYWAFVPLNGRSDLSNPRVTVYKLNGDSWNISAHKAMAWHPTMADKITQIDMLENVIIQRAADNNFTATKITTENMHYFPSSKMISSDAYIDMQQPGITISGQGMLGYLDKNWIELHENITTVYNTNVN